MRYFAFSYNAVSYSDSGQGFSFWIGDRFPNEKSIREQCASGISGITADNVHIISIFEFKNESDFEHFKGKA